MRFGRVERVEHLVDHLLRDAGTRFAHPYLDFGIRAHCCPDGDLARIRRVVDHRVHCVRCQIQQALQHMNGIGANQQWPFVAFSNQDNLSHNRGAAFEAASAIFPGHVAPSCARAPMASAKSF